MKKLLFGFLAMALGLVSCSQDIESPASENPEIKLTTKINPATRGTNTDEQSTAINMGQQVGITITGATADHKNVSWTVGSEGKLENQGDPVYYNGDNMVTITAYHPYNEAWTEVATGTAYTFNLASDQSGTGYADSDLLFAQTNAQKTTDAINLTFNHKLAKVSVFLTNSNNEDLSGAQIFISNTSTEVNFSNAQATATGNQVKDILAGTGNQAAAIIAPQTLTSGTEFVKVVWNGKNFYYTLPADKPILAGTAYTYRLRINNSPELNLDGSDIDDWNKEDNEGEMNEKIPYLTFAAEAEQTLTMTKAVATLEYSVNGRAWQTLGTNTVPFGGENGDLRVRGKSAMGTAAETIWLDDSSRITFGNDTEVSCSGDIRTLVDYENYNTADTSNARFCFLFLACTQLISAPALPATTLANGCYAEMFHGCQNLTCAPELPATTLSASCYAYMFSDCSSLSSAPELPATTLKEGCYGNMFEYCTSLTTAPELPATTLANYCYEYMFFECSNLTTASALPATTLSNFCYTSMFQNCLKLTIAPELPATTLVNGCYAQMFYGCANLKYIKMMAIDNVTSYYFSAWTYGVSSTGTFVKNAAATWNNDDVIPSGWIVADTDAAHNDHPFVDLGLPSGKLWAAMNMGAEGIYGLGTAYTWSDTDRAAQDWGGPWSVPSRADLQELVNGVNWEYTMPTGSFYNLGVFYGGYFEGTSKTNGNKIIIPATYFYYTGNSDEKETELYARLWSNEMPYLLYMSKAQYNNYVTTMINYTSAWSSNPNNNQIRPVAAPLQ